MQLDKEKHSHERSHVHVGEQTRSSLAMWSRGLTGQINIPPGRGCGFVSYDNRQAAEWAIERMQGFWLRGAQLRLAWGRIQGTCESPVISMSSWPQGWTTPDPSICSCALTKETS